VFYLGCLTSLLGFGVVALLPYFPITHYSIWILVALHFVFVSYSEWFYARVYWPTYYGPASSYNVVATVDGPEDQPFVRFFLQVNLALHYAAMTIAVGTVLACWLISIITYGTPWLYPMNYKVIFLASFFAIMSFFGLTVARRLYSPVAWVGFIRIIVVDVTILVISFVC